MSYKLSSFRVAMSATACLIIAAFISLMGIVQLTHAEVSATVSPISPSNNSYSTGPVTLSSKVNGLNPDQYEAFWAVGNGSWNRMFTNVMTGVSTDTIDISGWNWQSDNTYTLRFIALVKNGWYPIESSVTIKKGTTPVQIQTPAPTPTPSTTPAPTTVTTPQIKPLFTDPKSEAAGQLARNTSNKSLQYLASQPTAAWFTGDDKIEDLSGYMSRAAAANAVPIVVLYNIPHRDCAQYSAGGTRDYDMYANWIKNIAGVLNGKSAYVMLEPDALAAVDCLAPADQTARMNSLSQAVSTLQKGDTKVYLDAGHSAWQSSATMATRLTKSGIANASGFSVNVSNFRTTTDSTNFGTDLSSKLNNKHFVIDTSRNGNGPASDGQWCNPTGRALGQTPTTSTGNTLIDAYLWIKIPGESDGACGAGAPAAGWWWQAYADALYANKK